MEAALYPYIQDDFDFDETYTKGGIINNDVVECTFKKELSLTESLIPVAHSPHNTAWRALPNELDHIEKAIKDSLYILNLTEGWDGGTGVGVRQEIFERAINFLKNYSERAYDIFGTIISAPAIIPVNDGSIDLEWDTNNASLLVNICNSNENIAYYYGEVSGVDFDFNGKIPTNCTVDTFTAWLKNIS